ncbi:MAG: hypothetical protein KF868_00225 [Acidobacteria bacterium]|nr:hypothetical protein [Acidobacteriota bacterium]
MQAGKELRIPEVRINAMDSRQIARMAFSTMPGKKIKGAAVVGNPQRLEVVATFLTSVATRHRQWS